MKGSKNLALMFLLGTFLTGGVLGFTADRVLRVDRLTVEAEGRSVWRQVFDQELALTPGQQVAVDEILDAKHRQVVELLRPVQPQLDSLRDHAREQINALLTPEQQQKFERWKQREARRERERAAQTRTGDSTR
ncbi:MAG TPA: hypothetical protein VNA89_03105 [Gemmatimonadaceae bacterium]|nr:hypothetical protein [Gemmatimonadaceae bacterium]